MTDGLAQRAIHGALWAAISQAVRLSSLILTATITARLLTPSDFGLWAMLTPITALVLMVQDFGLTQAIVQARKTTKAAESAVFAITAIAATFIALLVVIFAPVAGEFYNDKRLPPLVAASAATVFVTGNGLFPIALFARDLHFRKLAVIECLGAGVLLVSTVAAAVVLKSYWAFFLGTLSSALVQTATVWAATQWRPSCPAWKEGRAMLRFGAGVSGFNLVNYVVRNMDNVLLGRFAGAAQLGLYDQAYRLMMVPMQAINAPLGRVMLPVLSRLVDEPERFRVAYVRTLRVMLLACTPALAVAVANSHDIMEMLLGEQWRAAGEVFFWLSLTGILQPIANATGWLFLSSGRTGSMFRWGVLSAIITAVGFGIGIRWGGVGLAMALFLTLLIRMPILFAWCRRGTSVQTADFYKILLEPIFAVTVFAISVNIMTIENKFIRLLMHVVIAYSSYGAVFSATASGRLTLIELGSRLVAGRTGRG